MPRGGAEWREILCPSVKASRRGDAPLLSMPPPKCTATLKWYQKLTTRRRMDYPVRGLELSAETEPSEVGRKMVLRTHDILHAAIKTFGTLCLR